MFSVLQQTFVNIYQQTTAKVQTLVLVVLDHPPVRAHATNVQQLRRHL